MTLTIRVLAALLLAGAALLARNEARLARAEADRWQQLATLRYDEASTIEMPDVTTLTSAFGEQADAARVDTTIDYWLGRYDDLADQHGGSTDPDVLFVAANAGYRVARRDQAVGPEAARQLDPVLRAYANVLRAAPEHGDAAYNLEYVARLRNRLATMKPLPASRDRDAPRAADPLVTGDLPVGPTVHGLPGGPPPDVKTEEFEVIVPRGYDDREADPEQAPGTRMRRRG